MRCSYCKLFRLLSFINLEILIRQFHQTCTVHETTSGGEFSAAYGRMRFDENSNKVYCFGLDLAAMLLEYLNGTVKCFLAWFQVVPGSVQSMARKITNLLAQYWKKAKHGDVRRKL